MLILASQSPRRSEILKKAGYDFKIIPADTNEEIKLGTEPEDAVKELSRRKAEYIKKISEKGDIIIAADTVVYIDGEILGKPSDHGDAYRMLKKLSGRVNYVYTGYCIIKNDDKFNGFEKTDVEFIDLSDDEINRYIDSGEPMDKAGAYGMQDGACIFVKKITGDPFNVLGLPVCIVNSILKKLL